MLLDGDGYDHYGTSIATMLNGIHAAHPDCTIQTATKRTGTGALLISTPGGSSYGSAEGYWRRPIPAASQSFLGVSCAQRWNALPGSNGIGLSFLDLNSASIGGFGWRTDGRVSMYRGNLANGGTVLCTSVFPVLQTAAFNHYEFKYGVSATVGFGGMRVNGVDVLWNTGTGLAENLNTSGTGNNITQIRGGTGLGHNGVTTVFTGNAAHYWDDLLVWNAAGLDNNDYLGDQQLHWRPPVSDHPTLPLEFVPSTGATLWDLIDEGPPSTADYIRALTSNKQAAFGIAPMPSDITEVRGIIPYIYGKKLNPGSCSLETGMLTNSVVGDALYQANIATIAMTTADSFYRTILERNPDTALPYLPAEVDASYLYLDRVL